MRREQLGLSQGDVIKILGYKTRMAVSNIETGNEGVPAKRAYAWADVLEVPRDPFFRFVTGDTESMEPSSAGSTGKSLTSAEEELLAEYRRLPAKYQRRLREHAHELGILASADLGKRR